MDLNAFLDRIKDCEYALIKVDVPYMPEEFPDVVPIGKDLDIICKKKNFDYIYQVAISLFANYKIVKERGNFRLRIMKKKKLYYQIDVTYNYMGKLFTDEALRRRRKKGNYYVLSDEDEVVVRLACYEANPNKKYHLDYINRHLDLM